MHHDHPIQQLVKRRDTRFQVGFAKEAQELVPGSNEFVLAASHRGLRILGKNEDALSKPVEVLREFYRESLQVRPPEVRLIEGVQVKQPIMHLRIRSPIRFLDSVKRALLERGAVPQEQYLHAQHCALHYEAPLAHLLGLPGELSLLGGGQVKHWIVLSHYALVTGDPGGRAA